MSKNIKGYSDFFLGGGRFNPIFCISVIHNNKFISKYVFYLLSNNMIKLIRNISSAKNNVHLMENIAKPYRSMSLFHKLFHLA